MTTILDEIKKTIKMPKELWDYGVYGPQSLDDEFAISFWFQEKKDSQKIYGKMIIKLESIEYKK